MTASASIRAALDRAVALHRAGRLDDAAAAYDEVLARDPDNADALNLLGVIAQSRGRHAAALAYLDRAAARAPHQANIAYHQGLSLAALGRTAEAAAAYRRAIQLQPGHAEALLNLGGLLYGDNDAPGAIALFRQLIDRCPADARGHYNLGRCLYLAGDDHGADAALSAALRLDPQHADALFLLAHLARRAGRLGPAHAMLARAIAAAPDRADYHSQRGQWLTQDGRHAEACAAHATACALAPERAALHFNRGNALCEAGDVLAAVAAFEQAARCDPLFAAAHVNRGEVLRDLGRYDEAVAAFDCALDAAAAGDAGPVAAAAQTNKALTLLAMERFVEGWAAYRRRFDHQALAGLRRQLDVPEWRGDPIADKVLLLWTDQGLGDEILYSAMVPEAARRARRCILECSPRLVTLFARSFPGVEVRPRPAEMRSPVAGPPPDVQASVPDLGGILRTSLDQFPRHRGYLRADPHAVSALRRRYAAAARGRPVVGVSWHSASATMGAFKSMPAPFWRAILERDDALFVSLQYADTARGEDPFAGRVLRDDSVDPLSDLDRFAAQVAAMDLVVSVSNTTVHVAGALGVPVWTLVPKGRGALWYFHRGTATPWYPSMTLWRQATPGDWPSVAAAVAAALAAWLKNPSAPRPP